MRKKYFVKVLKHNPAIGVGTEWEERFDTKRDALKIVRILNEETDGKFKAELLPNEEQKRRNASSNLFESIRRQARKTKSAG